MDIEIEESGRRNPPLEGETEPFDLRGREGGGEEGKGTEGILDRGDLHQVRHRSKEAPPSPGKEGAGARRNLIPPGDVEPEGDRSGKAPLHAIFEEGMAGVAGKKEATL